MVLLSSSPTPGKPPEGQLDGGEGNVKVMHNGELFDIREIAAANRKSARRLGLKPRQLYLVIS